MKNFAPEKADEPGSDERRSGAPLTVTRDALLIDGTDQRFRKLVHDFFAFTARHADIRDGHARRIGLSGIDYTILISVAHLCPDGEVNVKTLAEHLHVTTGFIANATKRLQGRGLINKTQDTVDKRRIILTVTVEGLDLLEQLAPYQRQVNDVEFGALSREQFVQLGQIVETLIESSEQAASLQHYLETTANAG